MESYKIKKPYTTFWQMSMMTYSEESKSEMFPKAEKLNQIAALCPKRRGTTLECMRSSVLRNDGRNPTTPQCNSFRIELQLSIKPPSGKRLPRMIASECFRTIE